MAKRPEFTVSLTSESMEHLDWIEAKHHGLIRREIHEQLTHLPLDETRNRKPLDQPAPFEASWELRCRPGNRFRILYEVDSETLTVRILAIGLKERNRWFFGGEEYTP
jgi:mRNA-degrading endonuclease RelE of RelBE toxin-antitoxin system